MYLSFMRHLFILIFFASSVSFAQDNYFTTKKSSDNSFGVYAGASYFNNSTPISNGYYELGMTNFYDPALYFKHNRHQFMAGPIIIPAFNRDLVPGGTLSYLYHFGNKRVHLFAEGNLKNMWYTINANDYMAPYNQTRIPYGGYFCEGKLMVLVAHAALGVEIKIFRFLYAQLAFGPGYYFIHSKPGYQVTPSYNAMWDDPFNSNAKNNFYKNHSGPDLYGRIGLAWRIHTF